MNKTEYHEIEKGVGVYRQTRSSGSKSKRWYSRVYMPDDTGRQYHVRSTGTSDLDLAKQKAKEHRFQCDLVKRGKADPTVLGKNRINPEKRFDRVAEYRLKQMEAEAGSNRKALRKLKDESDSYFAKNGSAQFFSKRDIGAITTDDIREFLKFRVEHSQKGKLASSSQKRSLVCLRLIFKSAYERGLIANIPIMPKIKVERTPRGWLDKKEYRLLWEKARVLARQAKRAGDSDGYDRWMEMFDFIIFMVNTFLRPSEWSLLQHKHIEVIDDERPYLRIAMGMGKTGPRYVLSMPRAVGAYKRMISRDGGLPDTYLFKHCFQNRQTAMERMRDHFEILLKATSLKHDRFGKARTIGSLRHTSLMFRFQEGHNIDLRTLADNAGTSIKQLEDFYLSHATVAEKIDNLHSFKPQLVKHDPRRRP